MKPEIEVKFLHVDLDNVRHELKNADAICEKPMRMMRRVIMDYPNERLRNERHGWLRVRDEGDKVTFTYKEQLERESITGIHEVETTVGSFDNTVALCKAIGLKVYSWQESKRETWTLGNCEVVLDMWPWVDPYIEIEGPDEASVRAAADTLGFTWSNGVFGGTTAVYRDTYKHIALSEDIGLIPEILFDSPVSEWLVERT